MIGLTSSAENCSAILKHGYSEAIDQNSENIAERVKELTDGEGVTIVYLSLIHI